MPYLLDTNTVIALMKGKDAVVGRVREAGLAQLRICSPVEAELWFGVAKSVRVEENRQHLLRQRRARVNRLERARPRDLVVLPVRVSERLQAASTPTEEVARAAAGQFAQDATPQPPASVSCDGSGTWLTT